ncbi:hypothetical protein AB0N17_02515 [Streptomyces sp. NPDC051133]|uniref:hypothetical protein n=1 Tax=Streptomyces sp. NPDC051133 TaxID=3155521 RepID=UPI003419E391
MRSYPPIDARGLVGDPQTCAPVSCRRSPVRGRRPRFGSASAFASLPVPPVRRLRTPAADLVPDVEAGAAETART